MLSRLRGSEESRYKFTPKSCPTRAGRLKSATPRASGDLGGEDSGDPMAVPFEHAPALGDVAQEQ